MRAKDHIANVRPILTLRTQYQNIPDWWCKHVEARIERIKGSRCWFWTGGLNHRGQPVTIVRMEGGRRRQVEVKRVVANMFWDLSKHWQVIQACGNMNCLNPRHFYVTALDWQQHDRAGILKRIRRYIADNRDDD